MKLYQFVGISSYSENYRFELVVCEDDPYAQNLLRMWADIQALREPRAEAVENVSGYPIIVGEKVE